MSDLDSHGVYTTFLEAIIIAVSLATCSFLIYIILRISLKWELKEGGPDKKRRESNFDITSGEFHEREDKGTQTTLEDGLSSGIAQNSVMDFSRSEERLAPRNASISSDPGTSARAASGLVDCSAARQHAFSAVVDGLEIPRMKGEGCNRGFVNPFFRISSSTDGKKDLNRLMSLPLRVESLSVWANKERTPDVNLARFKPRSEAPDLVCSRSLDLNSLRQREDNDSLNAQETGTVMSESDLEDVKDNTRIAESETPENTETLSEQLGDEQFSQVDSELSTVESAVDRDVLDDSWMEDAPSDSGTSPYAEYANPVFWNDPPDATKTGAEGTVTRQSNGIGQASNTEGFTGMHFLHHLNPLFKNVSMAITSRSVSPRSESSTVSSSGPKISQQPVSKTAFCSPANAECEDGAPPFRYLVSPMIGTRMKSRTVSDWRVEGMSTDEF